LRLYYDDFAKVPLCSPAVKEQTRIANFLTALDSVIASQVQKLEDLKTHKSGLMQQLFPSAEAAVV
jgi:type I restriction enzyme S subunit